MDEPQRRSVILSFFCLLLGAAPLPGQTGTIVGRVVGPDSARPIVGALVEAREVVNGESRSVMTNLQGAFRIAAVRPGSYTMRVAAVGFGTQGADTVHVTAGVTVTLSLMLVPRPMELNPVVVTSSRRTEKALEAPAHVEILTERDIEVRPALSMADHLRATPAVDLVTGGLQTTRVVVRGFNSSFSGSLHTLTDNRIASMPSMRVNLLAWLPQTNEDIERIEVVLGPGAALYGPNTANGVLHIITKSPIDHPGSSVSMAGGERSVQHVIGRSAVRLNEHFGFKVSGQYFRGNEWHSTDSVEVAARQAAEGDFDAWTLTQPVGLDDAELHRRADRIGAREFDVSRYSLDARADWRPTPNLSAILTAGRSAVGNGIEMAGVGAGMMKDWTYGYYQARLSHNRWFAQSYLNTSDAGNTFALRTGKPIVDRSKVWVAQVQHGATWRNVELSYGGDLIRTLPVTDGTIHGIHEESDNYTEYGAYAQANAALTPKLDLVLAGRLDLHTALNEPIFSPRAALVVKPVRDQTFRLTWNRSFSTPSSLDLFIDMDAGPAGSLGPLGFRVRAHGSGKDGIDLADSNGWPLGMRVPGQAGLVDVTAGNVFDAQLKLLIERLQANPATAGLVPLVQQLGPALKAGAAQVPMVALNPRTKTFSEVEGSVTDVPGIVPSISTVWELGYQGLIGERLLVAADAWRSRETDFTSSLLVRTPLYLLGPEQFGAFLSQNAEPQIVSALLQAGLSEAAAREQAKKVISNWVQIPGGVASSEELAGGGADLLATNVNLGAVDLWGFDLSAQWWVSKAWSTRATYSHVSDHHFCLVDPHGADCDEDDLLALNAPMDKLTASLAYQGPSNGFSGEVRVRHTGEFPVNTSVYEGLRCIGGGGEACVKSYTLFDFLLGYDLPIVPGASVQLAVTNLFDENYRSFVGVPTVGRLALLRLRREF